MSLPKPLRLLWGDLSNDEFKKFGILSLTLLFIIGAYWLIRPMKDAIFASLVGIKYVPTAKIISLCVLIPLTIFYGKLVDLFEKNKLFYVITTAYIVGFSLIALLLTLPEIGLSNKVASPDRILGWVTYVTIESFGSLMVALFWSFVASSTDPDSAKKGFPIVIFGAQIGSICGPTLATYAEYFGLPLLVGISVVSMAMVIVMVYIFTNTVGKHEQKAYVVADNKSDPAKKTGGFEGLKLLLTKPYVLGIFGISTLYEVVGTIMDFQLKVLATDVYRTPESLTVFLGHFGQSVNCLSLVFAFAGTSFLMRRYGLTFCLLLFPASVAVVIGGVYFSPGLWQVFAACVAIKGLTYALNNPTKEIMYIPTTKDVRYKAKSWIDVFGSRSAKAAGSAVNNAFKESASNLLSYGSLISLGVVAVWIGAAAYVGRSFSRLTKEGKVIEIEPAGPLKTAHSQV